MALGNMRELGVRACRNAKGRRERLSQCNGRPKAAAYITVAKCRLSCRQCTLDCFRLFLNHFEIGTNGVVRRRAALLPIAHARERKPIA